MPVLEEVSTITAKGQTTVPKAVRKLLGIEPGDKIAFHVDGRQVTLALVEAAHEDPVVSKFLAFIAKDIERRPEAVKPLSREFAKRMASLSKGKPVDLEAAIEGPVDL